MSSTASWMNVLALAARTIGIDVGRPVLMSNGLRTVVGLPDAGLVARISCDDDAATMLQTEIDCALLLARNNIPVIIPTVETAVSLPGAAATFWPWLEPVDTFAESGWLGDVLHSIHHLPDELPWSSDPLRRVRTNVARYAASPAADHHTVEVLLTRCHTIERQLMGLALSNGVVHGDPGPGNVIVTTRGPVLIDFDLAGRGPAVWDTTVPVLFHRRFGLPAADLDRFLDAYGHDPRAASAFSTSLGAARAALCLLRRGAHHRWRRRATRTHRADTFA